MSKIARCVSLSLALLGTSIPSGCIALSFGGGDEDVILSLPETESRLQSLEQRVQLLESQCGITPPGPMPIQEQSGASSSAAPGPVLVP